MNVHVDVDSEPMIEVSAKLGVKGKSPIDRLNTSLMMIVRDTYTAFRAIVVSDFSYQEGPIAIAMKEMDWLPNSLKEQYVSDLGALTGARIRDMIKVRPGDGKKPITLSFYVSVAAEAQIANVISKFGFTTKTGLMDVLRKQENDDLRLAGTAMTLLGDDAADVKKYAFFKDVCAAVVFKSLGDDGKSVDYRLDLQIDADLYPKVIDSDKFSPYLVYLWANNALSEAANRPATIFDPRKSASLTDGFIKKYGNATNPRPRVNKDGFALYRNGMPILIPAANYVDKFMQAADAAIDEDGEFNVEQLVEKSQMANRVIYVDWLNDILVYTTANCHIATLSLQGTSILDPATESALLATPIQDRDYVPFFKAVVQSVSSLGPDDIGKYMPKGIEAVDGGSAASIYARLLGYSGTRGKNSDITLAHMCGHNLDEFSEEGEELIPRLIFTFRAYTLALNAGRSNKSMELVIPPGFAAQGIRYRLIGLEYFIWALTNYDNQKVSLLSKAYFEEKKKGEVERVGTFDIPNVNTGVGGLTGLLPHQARIASSLQKVPRLFMAPVATGGGKTVLSFLRSLFGIDKDPMLRALITTKGSLVKGTISEINKMSGGKINAIPLRPVTLKRMKRLAGVKTFDDLMRWTKTLPPNTIFVNAYTDFASRSKIYQELPSIPGMLNVQFMDSQYQRIIRMLNFRMIDGDESHMIKNPDSNRSRGACAAFGAADNRGIMSGTMVSNTVLDLVGQSKAISPLIFGENADHFADKYGVSTGIIKDDDTARIIRERMGSVAAVHQATRDQWSYMLPDKDDQVMFANMTKKQEEFYDKLLQEAYLEMLAAEENRKKKGGKAVAAPVEGGDDEDEEEDDDDDEDEEDAEENSFLALAKTSLQSVEQFLSAPDENGQYLQLADKPEGIDLVSPKVALADRAIDAHMAKHRGQMGKNKVIVFGINLSAIRHFERHSKHRAKMLVYYAGDLETLRKFKDDPTYEIMVAAETSVREGENWQMSSLILKMQPPWAPGDYEQSLARMFRPDPSGKFNREGVEHVSILVKRPNKEPTLDGVKMARLISKFISNARVTWEGTPEWKLVSKQFEDLDMLRMNLTLIMETKNEDLEAYFTAWKTFVQWENQVNRASRLRKARELEQATGEDLIDDKTGKIKDINRFVALAMSKVISTRNIPGSKRVFVPWVSGSIPPDPDNFGFATLGSQAVRVGMVVYTEFGPAVVKNYSDRNLKVELYGGRVVGIRRLNACIVAPANEGKFAAIVKDPSKWRAASFAAFEEELAPATGAKPDTNAIIKKGKMAQVVDDEDGEDEPNDAAEDERDEIEVQTSIVNGMPALIVMDDVPELKPIGWKKVDPYLSVRFTNWTGATNLLEELDRITAINTKVYDRLYDEIDQLKTGKAMKMTKRIDPTALRNFFTDQRKTLGKTPDGKFICKPYFLVIEDDIRMAFDIDSHSPKIISWIQRNALKLGGVKQVMKKPGFYLNAFSSVVEARKHLTELVGVLNFDQADLTRELKELAEELRAMQQPRKRPL